QVLIAYPRMGREVEALALTNNQKRNTYENPTVENGLHPCYLHNPTQFPPANSSPSSQHFRHFQLGDTGGPAIFLHLASCTHRLDVHRVEKDRNRNQCCKRDDGASRKALYRGQFGP